MKENKQVDRIDQSRKSSFGAEILSVRQEPSLLTMLPHHPKYYVPVADQKPIVCQAIQDNLYFFPLVVVQNITGYLMISVIIRRLNGREFHVKCRPDWTVAQLKDAIAAVDADIPLETHKSLIYAGKQLSGGYEDDDRKLYEYKVHQDCNIWLITTHDLADKPPSPFRPRRRRYPFRQQATETMINMNKCRSRERDLRRRYDDYWF